MALVDTVVARKFERAGAPGGEPCQIVFEGEALAAKVGEPLSVTLLANDVLVASRSVKYHRPRGAFCLAGTCGQCWLRIDDVPNRPACQTPARPGLRAERQNAFPSADLDVFSATDWVFPGGLDHHRLGTTPVGGLNELIASTARQMAGFGPLSSTPPAPVGPVRTQRVDVVVVGSGPAGLGAALAASDEGLAVLLIERRTVLGGRLSTGLYPEHAALVADTPARLETSGGRAWTGAWVVGAYPRDDGAPPELLVRRTGPEGHEFLTRVLPDGVVLATGGHEQAGLYGGSDLPGHFGVRAFAELALVHGVVPARTVAIVESTPVREEARRLHAALRARDVASTLVTPALDTPGIQDVLHGVEPRRTITPTLGGARVRGLGLRRPGSEPETRTLMVEAVADGRALSAAFELAAQAGAAIEHHPVQGFVPRVSASLATTAARVFAAGELLGPRSAAEALAEGRRAGAELAARLLEVRT